MPRGGRSRSGDVDGSDYLTPYQRILEDQQIADAGLAERSNPENYANYNPLVSSRAGLAPVDVSAPPSVTAERNPLVAPPFPMSMMPTEQRIAWQQLNAKALEDQARNDKMLIDQQIAQRENEHGAEVLKQSRALIEESVNLDPTKVKDYPLARAALARKYAVGAGSAEVQRALAPLDEIHKQASGYDIWYAKQLELQNQTTDKQRVETAAKQADALGPDALARFFDKQKKEGNEAAIQGVMSENAAAQQANLITQLKANGLTDQEIAATYGGGATGREFQYPAAEAEAKRRVAPGSEAKRYSDMLATWTKQRSDARFDPTDPEPNPRWTPAQEQAYQNTFDQYNKALDRAGGNRGGVQNFPGVATGLSVGAASPSATVAPTPTPKATPTPTPQPAAERRILPDGRVAVRTPDGKWAVPKKRETK